MKKAKYIALLIAIILITGCSGQKSKVYECKGTSETDNYTIEYSYKISFKNIFVKQVKSKEIVKLTDESKVEEFKKVLEDTYSKYDKIDHYTNKISIKDNIITRETYIDYEKIDTKKLIEIDKNNESLISNGKVKVEKLVELYKSEGATCE